MPPWVQDVLDLVFGPFGAIFVLLATNYFQWKLFREEQKENRDNFKTVSTTAEAMKDLTSELKIWREAGSKRGSV